MSAMRHSGMRESVRLRTLIRVSCAALIPGLVACGGGASDGGGDDNCAEGFCEIAADDLPEAVWRILATGNFPEGFCEICGERSW